MTHTTNTSPEPTTGPGTGVIDARPTLALTEHTVATLTELLSMVEEFLRTASPNVHAELRGYLRAQWPPADPGWLIDMLGFHGLHLHHQLRGRQPSMTSPRENWEPSYPAGQLQSSSQSSQEATS